MYAIRRWWDRQGVKFGLIGITLASAWFIRQTQGALIVEVYNGLTRPFHTRPNQTELIGNAQIKELQERLIELESQNQRLQELLDYTAAKPDREIVAPVIGRGADHWWQQITIGRGSRQGVEVGDIVSGTGGLVGRVTQVTANTSRVLLVSDPSSQIGVTISRSRNMGYMRGQAENRAVMEFFDKVPDVRPGDVVATSSFSQLFPAGLPIGRVESVNLSKSPAPEAVIELSAPISHLEWVIVTSNPKDALLTEEGSPPNMPSRGNEP